MNDLHLELGYTGSEDPSKARGNVLTDLSPEARGVLKSVFVEEILPLLFDIVRKALRYDHRDGSVQP